jgi:hypothetical protein
MPGFVTTPIQHKVSLFQRVGTHRSGTHRLSDASSEGRVSKVVYRPRGRIVQKTHVQGTHRPWDAYHLGTHQSGTNNIALCFYFVFYFSTCSVEVVLSLGLCSEKDKKGDEDCVHHVSLGALTAGLYREAAAAGVQN